MLDERRAEFANLIFELGAVQFGEFRLKHHDAKPRSPLSPIKLHLRTPKHKTDPGSLTPEAVQLGGELVLGAALEKHENGRGLAYYAGIPEAGEPFVDAMETTFRSMGVSRFRLIKHGSGRDRRIDGVNISRSGNGAGVLLIDDVITEATTKLEALAALRAKDFWPKGIAVLVDRQEGGRERLEREVIVSSVFTLTELMEHYLQTDRISQSQFNRVKRYQKER